MSRGSIPLILLVFTFGTTGLGLAQGRPGSGRSASIDRFEAAAPAIGEPMPDLVIYDAGGKEVRLRDLLRDRYTVLVLGCLT